MEQMNLKRNEYITFFACKEKDNGMLKKKRKILNKIKYFIKAKNNESNDFSDKFLKVRINSDDHSL